MGASDLPLKEISRDDCFDFSFPYCPQRQASIENKFFGLPLLIIDKKKRLVWGHGYLRLLRARGWKCAPVLEADITPAAALFLNFNLSNRLFGLNLYEKLLFIKKISVLCQPAEIQRRADLDFKLDDVLLQRLDALLNVSWRQALASGHLGLKSALQLIAFTVSDQRALRRLFMKVRFSESYQSQIIRLLEEIAFREKKSLARILQSLHLAVLLKAEMPQRKIMEALNRRRFPAYARREREWRRWQKKRVVPGRVALAHAPFFDNEEIQIVLTAKTSLQADALLQKLK
ncbi:hypothetical protein EH223_09235 [candidate division KSB1 bacterium]|nr:hypothetical protein [Candidatus Aminicenantes bacterium]RQW03564.1 MAG: hypothetical protein EH223_09235 [candidate division KSB1 bacterium]